MSLTIGELVGFIRADDGHFVRALDGSDRRMTLFQRQADGTLRRVADDFGARGTQAGRSFRDGIDETLASLHPDILIDADSEPADEEVRALYRRLRSLRDAEIGVTIPPERALAELEEIRTALAVLSTTHADPTVQVNTRDGEFAINLLQRAIADVDAQNPVVRVRVDGDDEANAALRRVGDNQRRIGDDDSARRAGSRFGFLTSAIRGVLGPLAGVGMSAGTMAMKFGAVIPIVAALVTTLLNIVPAAAIAATALFAVQQASAVIKLGTSGMGDAFKAAFADAKTGGAGAAGGANKAASAMRAVKQATEQAALANQRAARTTADAERSLTDAKKAALQAERDLTQAREDATRALEDQNNSLEDAQLDQRQAVLDVADAEQELADVRATGVGDQSEAMQKAQLGYDRAVQRLEEQQVETKRLETDTEAANKAGVDGSKIMADANQRVADSHRTVQDQVRALADAQAEQARTAKDGLDAIRQAQESMAQSAGGAAGGVDALAEALAKLSPNARAFVQQVIALKPAWDSMKLAVQDRLFAGMAGTLKRTAGSVLPVLRANLLTTADALNRMGSASKGLSNLSGIPGMFVKALTQMAAAAGPAFEAMTKAMGAGAAGLGEKLSAAFKDGRMKAAIDTAIGLIKEIAGIAANVGSIVMSVMSAAQGAGGGFLGVVKEISGQLARAFNSPEVQGGLRSLFTTMAVLGKTVAPLLGQALKLIAPILEKLGPPAQTLIRALGVGIQPIIEALGPVLVAAAGAVGQLVTAAAPLLPVVGKLISKILPLLTPLIEDVSDIFVQLAPVIADVADQLGNGGLQPVFEGLASVIGEFVSQYAAQFMDLLQQLLPVIPQLIPVVLQLAESIGEILTELAPLLPQLSLLAVQMISELLPALLPLVPPLTQLTILFLRLATEVLVGLVIPAIQQVIDFLGGMQKKLEPGLAAVKWLTEHIAKAFEWLYDHLVGHSVIPDLIRSIVGWFAGLPGKAMAALSNLPGSLAGMASRAASGMIAQVKYGVDMAVFWLARLPGAAWTVLSGLGRTLWDSGRALIGGFIDGMWSKAQGAVDAARGILSNVKDFFPNSPAKRGPFSGAGWTLHSGVAVMEDWAAGMTSRHGVVATAVATAAGLAQQGLGGVGSPTASLVSVPGGGGGFAGGGYSSGSGAGQGTLRIVMDTTAGNNEMKNLLRKITRVEGGNVQTVFGTG